MNYRSVFLRLRYLAFGAKRTVAYTDQWSRFSAVVPTVKVLMLRTLTALLITGVFIQDSLVSNEVLLQSYYEEVQAANRADSAVMVKRLQDHLTTSNLNMPFWRVSIELDKPTTGIELASLQSTDLDADVQELELEGVEGVISFDHDEKILSRKTLFATNLASRSWMPSTNSRINLAKVPLMGSSFMVSGLSAWKVSMLVGAGGEAFSGSTLFSDVYLNQESDFTQVLATNGRALSQEVKPNTIVEMQVQRGLTSNLSAFVALRFLKGSASNQYVYQTEQQVTTIQTTRLPIPRSSSEGYSVETVEEEITTSTYAYDTLNVSSSSSRIAIPVGLRYSFLSGSRLRPSVGVGSDIVLVDQVDYSYQSSQYPYTSGNADLRQSGLVGLNAFALIGIDYSFGSGWNAGVQFSFRNRILDRAAGGMLHSGALSGALGIGYHF